MRNQWKFPLGLTILLLASMIIGSISPSVVPTAHAAPPYTITWGEKHLAPYAVGQAGIIGGLDGRVYVMGGFNGGSPFSTAIAYNPVNDSWSNLPNLPTPTRGPGIARGTNGLIYVLSGFSGSTDLSTNQIYNPVNNSWTSGPVIPTPVWMPGATTGSDGRIYLIGGENGAGTALTNVQIYNPQSATWSSGSAMPTGRKQFSIVAGQDGLIYAIGGYTTTGATSSVQAYNLTSDAWTTVSSLPSAVMVYGAALGPDGLIYVFGGSTSYSNNGTPYFGTVYSYDPTTDTWYTTGTLPTARRELGATLALNHRIYTIGGANGTYQAVNEEASLPASSPPVASISSITPSPATVGQTITFTGTGTSASGTIAAYNWRSSLSGNIGSQASFSRNDLPAGTHMIYFSVEDNFGTWSTETSATLTINSSQSPAAIPGFTTMAWLGLAAVVAAIGAFVYLFVMSKNRKNSPADSITPPSPSPSMPGTSPSPTPA